MTGKTRPDVTARERGMILINVLIIVMLATSVLAIVLASEQDDVDRTAGLRFAAQAQATARGAELSAVAALRRDLARDSQATLRDEWATIGDRDVKIPGGRFSLVVADAQARFNVNNLARADAISRDIFARIVAAAGLKAEVAERVIALLALGGPVDELGDLRTGGLSDADIERLAPMCTALPRRTDINVNTAPEALLTILVGSNVSALMSLRQAGGPSAGRMQAPSVMLPPGVGDSSDFFWSRAEVQTGDSRQKLTSLLYRHLAHGQPVVVAIRRWRGTAPSEAPPLS